MKCPNCKFDNSSDVERCPCGHDFKTPGGKLRSCPFCAETIQAAAIKCRYCGESISSAGKSKRRPTAGIAAAVVAAAIGLAVINNGFEISPAVTRAGFERIQPGMTYADALSIIGAPGVELSHSEIAGYTTVMYSWKNSNGSNMNAMFQNGQLVNKAQFGLR